MSSEIPNVSSFISKVVTIIYDECFDYYLTFNYKQYLQIRRQVIVHTTKKIAA